MMHAGAQSGSGPLPGSEAADPRLPPPTTTSNENGLLASLTQLSLQQAATAPLPPTPRSTTPNISRNPSSATRNNRVFSPLPPSCARKAKPAPFGNDQTTATGGPRSPTLRRQASSNTLEARANAPTLLRKASMNSLQKANSNAHNMNGGSHSPRASTSRRSSYSQDTGSIGRALGYGKSPLSVEEEKPPKPAVTAESIAHEYFTKIMTAKEDQLSMTLDGTGDEKKRDTETIVILHDACYGHRFSRPKTSKSALSTIVERPERIHASILGVSAAYVRLGELHPDGKDAITPEKEHGEDDEHNEVKPTQRPFDIIKSSRRLPLGEQAVTNVHGVKWMEELKMLCEGAEAKLAHNGKELIRPTMDRGKGAEEPQKLHEGDLYLCSDSLEAMEGALGAVCDGVDAIFSEGGAKRAFVVVRPPGHHCSAGYPSGFCWVNNVHVGIQHAALAHGLTHAAIIDFDLHHGDGSQDITWGHNERGTSLPKNAPAWKKTSIGYFSIHDINSYPCEMGDTEKVKNASLCIDNAHGQNIWNVHLAPWKSEEEFWKLYESKYAILLDKTRLFLKGQTERINEAGRGIKPRAAIFLSAGFDASEHESSGMQRHKVNVPTEFYARLTRDVRRIAEEEGTSVNGRIISVLEGGYSDRALCSGVFSHVSGLAGSDPETYEKPAETTGLGAEVARRMGNLSLTSSQGDEQLPAYDPSWWKLENLEALEAATPPPQAPVEPKKPRENGPPATYYASTQSFDAKITESPKGRRSSSGLFAHPPAHGYKPPSSTSVPVQQRAPTLPPPDVSWAVAAKEMCKVLIPTDRQTISCRPEDLNAAATRERKERQSLTIQSARDLLITPPQSGPVSPEPTPSIRKSTRERKPARPVDTAAEEAARAAAASRTSRRRTVAGAGVIATEPPRPVMPGRGSSVRDAARGAPVTSNSSNRRASVASNADTVMGGMDLPTLPVMRAHDGAAETSQAAPRASTSAGMRPVSSASARGGPAGIAVRKPRAPPVPRGAAAGLASTRAPVARQPSASLTAPPAAIRRPSGVSQVDDSSDRRPDQRAGSVEMENLTSSMSRAQIAAAPPQKPRITLTTKAQRDAAAVAAKETTAPLTSNTHNEATTISGEPEHETLGLEGQLDHRQNEKVTEERPEYNTTTSQLHASQQLTRFDTEEEKAQVGRHLDQLQHDELRRDEEADRAGREEQRGEQRDEQRNEQRDERSIIAQLKTAAQAATEIAGENGGGGGAVGASGAGVTTPPPPPPAGSSRPTTSGDGNGNGNTTARPQSASSGGGVHSPSSIQDRIQRLAKVSQVALESAREMGSGRSSFSDVKSPPRAHSEASGRFVREGPAGVKREELPVWSATGVIPFAPVMGDEKVKVKKEEKERAQDGIWEVSDTPQK